jgi:hypothetical protein
MVWNLSDALLGLESLHLLSTVASDVRYHCQLLLGSFSARDSGVGAHEGIRFDKLSCEPNPLPPFRKKLVRISEDTTCIHIFLSNLTKDRCSAWNIQQSKSHADNLTKRPWASATHVSEHVKQTDILRWYKDWLLKGWRLHHQIISWEF